MSTLSDYLNDHIPPSWRKPQVVEALHGVIDRATVYKYLAGSHPRNPPEAVLQAFASVLPGVSVVELRAASHVPLGSETPWVPTVEANRLNEGQRQALDMFIKATVASTEVPGQGAAAEVAIAGLPREGAQQRSDGALLAEQRTKVLEQVDRLRRLGRDDLAEAVLETLEPRTASGRGSAHRPQRP